jgi:small GTP-binding protein
MDDEIPLRKLQISLAGEANVGKTNLLSRWYDNSFSPHAAMTMGLEFQQKIVIVGDYRVLVRVKDTAGQERFAPLLPAHFNEADAVVLVYDIAAAETFTALDKWRHAALGRARADVRFLLVGNKCDLTDDRQISVSAGHDFARRYGMLFAETSAKDDMNVHEAFAELINAVVDADWPSEPEHSGLNWDVNEERQPEKYCC